MKDMPTPLRRLIRQAEHFGTIDVWPAARRTLEPLDRGRLALHLRRIDPEWKLSRVEAMELAVDLAVNGVGDREIRRMAGMSQPTVRKARSRAARSESFGEVLPRRT